MKTWTIWILVNGEWIFEEEIKAARRKDVTAVMRQRDRKIGTWKVRQGSFQ